LFWDLELRNSVLCTHGEGIGLLLTRLLADALLAEDPLDWPKGSTWLLERINRRQIRGRFLGPVEIMLNR
jgi:ABC-type antimicrobial peptide transport system permease subunit